MFFDWDEVEEHHKEISSRLEIYLSRGLYDASDFDSESELIELCAEVFISLVSSYSDDRLDSDKYLNHLVARADLFHNIWREASIAPSDVISRNDIYSVFQDCANVLPAAPPRFESSGKGDCFGVNRYADLLSQGLKKAFREYQIALAGRKEVRIKHQTALLGDVLDEMQDLFHYMDMLGSRNIGEEENAGA